jgi:cell division protein FtsB
MEKTERQEARVVKRKSAARGKRGRGDSMNSADDREDVVVLKQRIFQLEAENKQLRKQIAALNDTMSPSQPGSDSVREQQHNFFKYGNVRRY